jgi:hypothetical protein
MKAVWIICITVWVIATEFVLLDWTKFAVRVEITTRALHIFSPLQPEPTPADLLEKL